MNFSNNTDNDFKQVAKTTQRESLVRKAPLTNITVNDIHSQLNATEVDQIVQPHSLTELQAVVAWAREAWACVVFNLHVTHDSEGIRKAHDHFRRLIDRAIEHGGSYNLTYHRWATREQVAACYPQFIEFLRRKQQHDSAEIFQSDWYRHYKSMFADQLTGY